MSQRVSNQCWLGHQGWGEELEAPGIRKGWLLAEISTIECVFQEAARSF